MNAHSRTVTRDISYASSARSRGGRALIRLMENATGRLTLIRRAEGYENEIARGCSFWEVIPSRFGLTLDVAGDRLDHVPAGGPLRLPTTPTAFSMTR